MYSTNNRTPFLYPKLFFIFIFSLFISCKEELLPKPKGQLRLSYDNPTYNTQKTDCGFSFKKNKNAQIKKTFKNEQCGYKIYYKNLNATIYLSHRSVNNDLKKLLQDAQNLTQEHVIKADEIIPKSYENKKQHIYGMFYEVLGNAASQSQFYVTDSTSHFLLGSVYFNTKPNYDSIYPAAKYLQKDMQLLMESIEWRN